MNEERVKELLGNEQKKYAIEDIFEAIKEEIKELNRKSNREYVCFKDWVVSLKVPDKNEDELLIKLKVNLQDKSEVVKSIMKRIKGKTNARRLLAEV